MNLIANSEMYSPLLCPSLRRYSLAIPVLTASLSVDLKTSASPLIRCLYLVILMSHDFSKHNIITDGIVQH